MQSTERSGSLESEDSLHVLDGAIDLWIDNQCTRLVAGMSARLPHGIAHGFDSVGPETVVAFRPGRAARKAALARVEEALPLDA